MSRIRGRDTAPELLVRSALHRAGYRFRLHREDLPGRPDIVLPKYRTVVFVHGCFWHRHKGCRFAYTPKSRVAFWNDKFRRNVERDRRNARDAAPSRLASASPSGSAKPHRRSAGYPSCEI